MIKLMQRQARFFTYKTVKYQRKVKPFFIFLKELVANPREIGAGCPSSPYLGQAMAQEIDGISDGIVLELGGGTGAITRSLLERGVSADRLIVIEQSPTLAVLLRQKFPNVRVIQGDASQVDELLGPDSGKVSAVVSSLPLRSLPKECVSGIKQQINKLLDAEGVYVQFTYDLRLPPLFQQGQEFSRKSSQIVWRNFPPARVDTFKLRSY